MKRTCEQCGEGLPPDCQLNRRFCDACKHERAMRRQREIRRADGNAQTKRYEKSPNGYLMRAYRNMKSRVAGVQGPGSWVGKPILPKEDFYSWSRDNPEFWRLFRQYKEADCDQRLAPSVNRIDPTQGYTLDNMEWITHSVNSALSSLSKKREEHEALKGVADLVA